jgi:DNA recombination protein RmuC
MNTSVVIALVAGLVVGAALVAVLWWRRPARGRNEERSLAELSGRLSQMAESQAAQQSRMAEQLQAQERAVAKALEDRLGDLAKKVGDRLQESSTRSQETLTDLRERLAVIDKAQQNITELSTQVVGLQDILANKQARGAFGEVQLRDIVEAILPPSVYEFQATLTNNRRADCLLKLPNPPGPIAIDAKFPLESFEALRRAEGELQLRQARSAFAADVRRHVRDIAERYILPGETAESALMFLPSEAVYAELHADFREVIEDSFRNRVWIVSPTTLMATLNTVRAILKDVRMREQAGLIQREVGVLLVDIERLVKRVGNLETHFDHARRDIDQIKTSTGKIVSRGERLTALELEDEQTEAEEDAILGETLRPALPEN